MSLLKSAKEVRENAYAPYSNFKVGSALRAGSGAIYVGCNVENASYPVGTCAEAGAIAAMVAAGETEIHEILVIAHSQKPTPPCGACRQKIAEFANPDTTVVMTTMEGATLSMLVRDLLPGAFGRNHFDFVAANADANADAEAEKAAADTSEA